MKLTDIQIIEHKIGYEFKDKSLIINAFTHSSYLNENRCISSSYDRLEFLGDSILDFLVSERLYFRLNKDEGEMTTIRAGLVSKKPLAEAIDKLEVFQYLLIGNGAKNDLKNSEKPKSDLFESILAAIYIDSGKRMDEPRAFIERNIKITFENADYKSKLQEYTQKKFSGALPVYENETFENGVFTEIVSVCGKVYARGKGESRKKAQQDAAKQALLLIKTS